MEIKGIRVSHILSAMPTFQGYDPEGRPIFNFPFKEIDPHILANKCEIGTSVHKAIEEDMKHSFFPLQGREKGYFESYLIWKDKFKPTPVHLEKRWNDEVLGISGQIDLVANIDIKGKGQELCLIDWKTSASPEKDKWPLQAALYYLILKNNGIDVEKTVRFIQLDAKGDQPKIYYYSITQELLSLALFAVSQYKWLTRK